MDRHPYRIPRCQVVPESDFQTSFAIDGRKLIHWNFGHHYPRPFFHPVIGPSGANLVRMGHPGAPNHDHHSGIWFAHNMVEEFNFWANQTGTQIRQRQWLDYIDSDEYAAAAFILDYYDGHDESPLLTQTTISIIHPLEKNEYILELHMVLESPSIPVTLHKTNFGVVAVRVCATISEHFGGGTLMNDLGVKSESNLFGKPSTYMDYSGPVRDTSGDTVINGLTLFDHPSNPNFPAKWHVREDGWMGPSLNRDDAIVINKGASLELRYQVHVHAGALDPDKAVSIHRRFKDSKSWIVKRSSMKHREWEIQKAD